MFPFGSLDEMGKQNVAVFEQAMQIFTPQKKDADQEVSASTASGTPNAQQSEAPQTPTGQVEDLQKRLDEMQRQINEMSK